MVRLKAYDLYFSKIKKFFILPQSPLISARIEEGHFLKFLKMLKIAIFTFPQLLQKSKAIEVGCEIFLFLKNMHLELSNALFRVCLRQKSVKNAAFEIFKKFENFKKW